MASAQLTETTQLITGMFVTVAVAVVAVAAISFFVARRFGGQSKPKRQAIFTVVSGLGLLGVMYFIYLRTSGRA